MTTSNKLIVALFLTPVIIVSGVLVTLFVKLKNEQYISETAYTEQQQTIKELQSFEKLDLAGLKDGYITVKKGDVYEIRINNKPAPEDLDIQYNGGILAITSANYLNATIICPEISALSFGANVELKEMDLKSCVVTSVNENARVTVSSKIDSLVLDLGPNTSADLAGEINILSLKMANHSSLSNSNGYVNRFGTVELADSSNINLSGKILTKLIQFNN